MSGPSASGKSEEGAASSSANGAADNDRKVRVAFVGAGGIAAYHLANLIRIPEAQVVGICDLIPEAAARAAERMDLQKQPAPSIFDDYRRMLGELPMDALYVCVPPFAHEDAEVLAVRRGVHLFVEKPVALHLDKALEVLAAVRKSGVISASGYLLRYWASTQAAREFLRGRQISIVASDRWSSVPGGPEFWWRDMSKSGGQLHEMTTHQVDLMRYLAGEITRVDARHSYGVLTDLPNMTVPDSQVALLEFVGGAIGYISNSCVLTRGGHQGRLEFLLRDMVLRWGETLSLEPDGIAELPEQADSSLNIDEAFVAAVAQGDRELVHSPYEEAVKTLAVTIAARESAERGVAVEVQKI